ncbi:hypothetical protein [Streptomyces sp. CS113]|uniref:hypothetical protein n=1 Tax=Streptomyces sp. CS113 TaxID=1982761 RepID=UPI0015C674B3|nr:hypothetical protein [Streptomyces sp. CS113]
MAAGARGFTADADRLDAVLGAWAVTRTALVADRRVIAIEARPSGAHATAAPAPRTWSPPSDQKSLFAQLKSLPCTSVPAVTRTDQGHGRRVTRTIKVDDVPAWVEFSGAVQVAQLRRTATRMGRRTVETVYLITGADAAAASPVVLAAWVQSYWQIENRLLVVALLAFLN